MKIAMLTAALALTCGAAQFSDIQSKVSIRSGDNPTAAATVNTPLAAGDRVATGSKSRASIQLDTGLSLVLAAKTEILLEQLDAAAGYRLAVVSGTVDYYVAPDFTGRASLDTPNVGLQSAVSGVYRIVVKPGSQSEITTRQGAIQAVAPNGSEWVNAGRKLVARGSAADPEYKIGSAVSFWKKAAFVVANSVQIADVVVSAMPSGDGDRGHDRNVAQSFKGPGGPPPDHPQQPPAARPEPPSRSNQPRQPATEQPARPQPANPARASSK